MGRSLGYVHARKGSVEAKLPTMQTATDLDEEQVYRDEKAMQDKTLVRLNTSEH